MLSPKGSIAKVSYRIENEIKNEYTVNTSNK